MSESAVAFGHSATIEVRDREGRFVTKEIKRVGPRRVVERAARLTTGFVRVVDVTEHDRDEYVRAFGWGKM
jgi:hypothetical protein